MKKISFRIPEDMHTKLVKNSNLNNEDLSDTIRNIIRKTLGEDSKQLDGNTLEVSMENISSKINMLSLKLDRELNKLKAASQLIGETNPIISRKIRELFGK